jgi:hypothetical protein
MEQDRTYWRTQDDKRLIDEAKYYPSVELCIALAERLQDTDAQGLAEQLDDTKDELHHAKRTIDSLLETIETLEAQIDGLIYGDNDND